MPKFLIYFILFLTNITAFSQNKNNFNVSWSNYRHYGNGETSHSYISNNTTPIDFENVTFSYFREIKNRHNLFITYTYLNKSIRIADASYTFVKGNFVNHELSIGGMYVYPITAKNKIKGWYINSYYGLSYVAYGDYSFKVIKDDLYWFDKITQFNYQKKANGSMGLKFMCELLWMVNKNMGLGVVLGHRFSFSYAINDFSFEYVNALNPTVTNTGSFLELTGSYVNAGISLQLGLNFEKKDREKKAKFPKEKKQKETEHKQANKPTGDEKEFGISTRNITLDFWDSGRQIDGDIITILLNGKVIRKKMKLRAKHQQLTVELTEPNNEITIIAVNEGKVPPNTTSVSFFNGEETVTIDLESSKKENAVIRLNLVE